MINGKAEGKAYLMEKIDSFDSLDEAWSQWIEALRVGRARTYVPIELLPKDPNTGEVLKPNYFDNKYIKIGNPLSEKSEVKIDTEQPVIPTENYIQTYITALDLCLQGLISPHIRNRHKEIRTMQRHKERKKRQLFILEMLL